MKLKAPKRKERELSAAIIALLRAHGILAWRTGGGAFRIDGRYIRMGTKGVSDIVAIRPISYHLVNDSLPYLYGQTICIEVKSPTGRVRPEQTAFLAEVERHGGLAFVARSVSDVVDKLGLGRGAITPREGGQ